MSDSLPRDLKENFEAFGTQLSALMPEHSGEFALFADGQVVAFFPDYTSAFEGGLERFGVDGEFMIQAVEDSEPEATSISWEAGVAFG